MTTEIDDRADRRANLARIAANLNKSVATIPASVEKPGPRPFGCNRSEEDRAHFTRGGNSR